VDIIDRNLFHSHQTARPVRDPHAWGEQVEGDEDKFDDNSSLKMLSAGRAIEGTSIRVLDQHGDELTDRQIGEIAIRSDCMLSGYFNRPDLSEKAFKDGWYLTGDLGYLVEGELFVTGRLKDLIIVGGKNIYPGDLETLASEVDGVHPGRVAAFGVFNPKLGTEEVVLMAESDLLPGSDAKPFDLQTSNPQAGMLASEIRKKVTRSSDVSLRYVHIVGQDWLIKTSSGKVARSANREKYLQHISNKNV
jgi:acyl-CoA synthetase (AMP-forming)/AMP-acid ligase II